MTWLRTFSWPSHGGALDPASFSTFPGEGEILLLGIKTDNSDCPQTCKSYFSFNSSEHFELSIVTSGSFDSFMLEETFFKMNTQNFRLKKCFHPTPAGKSYISLSWHSNNALAFFLYGKRGSNEKKRATGQKAALRTHSRCLRRLIPRQRPQLGKASASPRRSCRSGQRGARAEATADALLSHHQQPWRGDLHSLFFPSGSTITNQPLAPWLAGRVKKAWD